MKTGLFASLPGWLLVMVLFAIPMVEGTGNEGESVSLEATSVPPKIEVFPTGITRNTTRGAIGDHLFTVRNVAEEGGEALLAKLSTTLFTRIEKSGSEAVLAETIMRLQFSEVTVAAGESARIGFNIYYSRVLTGTFYGEIKVESNDPETPELIVPVTLTIRDGIGPKIEITTLRNPALNREMWVLVFAGDTISGLPEVYMNDAPATVTLYDEAANIYKAAVTLESATDQAITVIAFDGEGDRTVEQLNVVW